MMNTLDRPPYGKVLLLHGYSRRNAGDGLLVDESLALLERAGVPRRAVTLVAQDTASFAATCATLPALRCSTDRSRWWAAMSGLALLSGLDPMLCRYVAEADAVVAVGGGYLRSGTLTEGFKTLLAMGPQLRAASRADRPVVYLPQSIGPLRGPAGSALRSWLSRVDTVCVRDDRSAAETPGSRRFPDLAVLRVAANVPRPCSDPAGPVLLACRGLARPGDYDQGVRQLFATVRNTAPVVQSEAGGANDDRAYLARLGLGGGHPTLLDAVATLGPSVVVSTRLHGAVQAILAGVPAIHLSYERKGFAAFADLGLDEYVLPARRFDPTWAADLVARLRSGPESYWQRIDEARPGLLRARDELDSLVAGALAPITREPLGAGSVR